MEIPKDIETKVRITSFAQSLPGRMRWKGVVTFKRPGQDHQLLRNTVEITRLAANAARAEGEQEVDGAKAAMIGHARIWLDGFLEGFVRWPRVGESHAAARR